MSAMYMKVIYFCRNLPDEKHSKDEDESQDQRMEMFILHLSDGIKIKPVIR